MKMRLFQFKINSRAKMFINITILILNQRGIFKMLINRKENIIIHNVRNRYRLY